MRSIFSLASCVLVGGSWVMAAESEKVTHVISTEAEYYRTGPQQGRPPDGIFEAGTRVQLLKKAGSYSIVRTEDGTKAYVASDVLREVASVAEVAVAEANNHFAWDLYGKVAEQEEGNLFFSPFSISTALAMTYAGAEGETEDQMAEVLHFSLPEEQLHSAYADLVKRLNTEEEDAGFKLYVANRLWGQEGYAFMPDFLITSSRYDAKLAEVDFVRTAERSRRTINTWVEERTQAKIKNLIPEGVLDAMTRLVLTNAIYFKGDWTEKFDPELTEEAPFHVSGDEEVAVPLMHQNASFKFGETEGIQILELPYGKQDLAMVVLLPEKADGLAALEGKVSSETMSEWLEKLKPQTVDVFLPRFKLESQFILNEALKSLGMTLAFDQTKADLSGISSSEQLYISAAIHKAFVAVDEEGTEAAAATGIAVGATGFREPPVVRADHPFIFLIRDNRTGAILFMGRLVRPS
jgi:serpin B